MDYIMGIDLGTSSIKALISDFSGKTVAIGQVGYDVMTPKLSFAEQDPLIWWEALGRAVKEALDKSGITSSQIAGIGLSGQMHGLVALGGDNSLVLPAIIWMDQRSSIETDELKLAAGELLRNELLNQPAAGMMISSLLWLKKNSPEIYEKIDKALLPKDYIRFMLTGTIGTDYTDGCATLAFSVKNGRWCNELIKRVGLKESIWPPVSRCYDIVGALTASAAKHTGLLEGTPVSAGGADSAMQLIGNSVIEEGTVAINIGTASQIAAVVKKPICDSRMRVQTWCHPIEETWYVQGGALNGGSTLSWLRNRILQDNQTPFSVLDKEASLVEAGSEGIIFIPYLAGERTPYLDPHARGVYFGLSMKHDKSHVVRATMEGVMYNIVECSKVFDEMGINKKRLISSGGAAKGNVWKQIQADMFNMPLYTTMTEEEACMGAAITAAVGIGQYSDIAAACAAMVRINETPTMPIYENAIKYKEIQKKFTELYFAIKNFY